MTRNMRTIRERLIEGVADSLGHQLTYCADDDIVHALELSAEEHPAIHSWWKQRIMNQRAVQADVKAVRLVAAEGRSSQHG